MISIQHNGALNAAAAGFAGGYERGAELGQRDKALKQNQDRLDLAKVESEAQLKLATEQADRLKANDALGREVQAETLAYTRQLRGERESEKRALDILDDLQEAGREYNSLNAPVDSPLSDTYVGPGSKQLEIIQRLDEAAKQLGPERRLAVMQAKGQEIAMSIMANTARKQAQRIGVLAGAGTPISGVPLGIMPPEAGEALIQGMELFVQTGGEQGLNPVEVAQNLTKLETEKAHEAAYQAEGARMLQNITAQHAVVAQSFPGIRMARSSTALAMIGMQSPKTQDEIDALQSVYMKAISEDLADASRLNVERERSAGRGNTGARRGAWNQKELYDAAVESLQPEFMDTGAAGEQIPKAIPIERVRTRMREIENGQEMTPDIVPMGSVPSTTSQTAETPAIEVPQEVQMGAQEMYAKARETMSVEEAKKAIEVWIRSQVNPIEGGGDGVDAEGSLIRSRNKQPVSKPKKKEPVRTGVGEDYMRDPKVRAALATKPRPRE